MIQVHESRPLAKDAFFYFSQHEQRLGRRLLPKLAGVSLFTKKAPEFQKLLEQTLVYFLPQHPFYAVLVESFPQYKGRLRTYAGLLYGWRKAYGEAGYVEKEFDLPENQSLFAGVLKLGEEQIEPFLQYLVSSELRFCLLGESGVDIIDHRPREFLDDLFHATVTVDNMSWTSWQQAVFRYTDPETLLMNITSDGQDRLRLEFFGPEALVRSKINEGLLPYLQERFYFRPARPRMNSKG